MTKYFTYRNIEFTVIAAGNGRIQCTAIWPKSIYELYRRPFSWTSYNTMAFDNCDAEKMPKGSYYKNAKAAQREFYTEYKQKLNEMSWNK